MLAAAVAAAALAGRPDNATVVPTGAPTSQPTLSPTIDPCIARIAPCMPNSMDTQYTDLHTAGMQAGTTQVYMHWDHQAACVGVPPLADSFDVSIGRNLCLDAGSNWNYYGNITEGFVVLQNQQNFNCLEAQWFGGQVKVQQLTCCDQPPMPFLPPRKCSASDYERQRWIVDKADGYTVLKLKHNITVQPLCLTRPSSAGNTICQ
eukprot:TRINITY_DN2238_c0_g1_i1.p1 TRINITY_DN2238_c0_g1~~TRINITY_DN2238_c0_g1_i1.p1  ORF type:complete len:225 (+),score=83.55 TRINITY_DN2238_c0_g1_i1:63-677(+)